MKFLETFSVTVFLSTVCVAVFLELLGDSTIVAGLEDDLAVCDGCRVHLTTVITRTGCGGSGGVWSTQQSGGSSKQHTCGGDLSIFRYPADDGGDPSLSQQFCSSETTLRVRTISMMMMIVAYIGTSKSKTSGGQQQLIVTLPPSLLVYP